MSADPINLDTTLGQFFTPDWAAEALVEQHFGDLGLFDRVVEPSCGGGAFLRAIPDHVPAVGVEIDPAWAAHARRSSGREVVVGDFLTAELPLRPTAIIGNPPFKSSTIQAFLDRAWDLLPSEGRAGFILPAYALQTSSVVERLARRWHLQQEMLPRDVFPRLSKPICFALCTKGPKRGLIGFSLYYEARAVAAMQRRYRSLMAGGQRSAWKAITQAALEKLGGEASLQEIYAEIEGCRPTQNRFWQPKVRQVLQRIGMRTGPGRWALPEVACAAA
jgi:hypothetical protein